MIDLKPKFSPEEMRKRHLRYGHLFEYLVHGDKVNGEYLPVMKDPEKTPWCVALPNSAAAKKHHKS